MRISKKGSEKWHEIAICILFLAVIILWSSAYTSAGIIQEDSNTGELPYYEDITNQENIDISYYVQPGKPFYIASDIVEIKIFSNGTGSDESASYSDLDLYIEPVGIEYISYKYIGLDQNNVLFSPNVPGEYKVKLISGEKLLDEKSFFVYDTNYDECDAIILDQQYIIRLGSYDVLLDDNEALTLPGRLELLHDDSYTIQKYVLSGIISPLVNWTPSDTGKYSLYADGLYIGCFEVVDDIADYAGDDVSAVGTYSINDSIIISGTNKTYFISNGSLSNFSYDHSRIKISDSSGNKRRVNLRFFVPDNKKYHSVDGLARLGEDQLFLKDTMPSNITNSSIENDTNTSSDNLIISSDNLIMITQPDELLINDTPIHESKEIIPIANGSPAPGQELVLDEIIENATYDIEINFQDASVTRLNIENLLYKENMEIGVDELDESKDYISGRTVEKAYAINLYDLEFNSSSFTAIASATELWKCKDWNFTLQECYGTWELHMNLTPGQEYSINLYPGDPGFVEAFDTNEAVDVDMVALDNNTVVIAWVSAGAGNNIFFEIYDTNGTLMLNTTTIDTSADAGSRISLAAINQNDFVIGVIDSPSDSLVFYVYNRSGYPVVSGTTADSAIGVNADVDVCGLEDRFVVADANGADGDADYRIYYNNGSVAVGELNVDGNMAPGAINQNLMSIDALNSTHWVYTFFDDNNGNRIYAAVVNNVGTVNISSTIIDSNAGETGQVATTALGNNRFALVFYDSADQDITIYVARATGSSFTADLAATDIELNVGAESRVAIESINMVTQRYFVVAWYNITESVIKAAIYNETGSQMTAPFTVSSTPSTSNRIMDFAGYDPTSNLGLCNGTWAIAYSNASGQAVWETYHYNGSRWDGVCPDVNPPLINLTAPPDNSPIFFNPLQLNLSVYDDRYILKNCSLYANFSGSWAINHTYHNITTGSYTFNVSISQDNPYIWNVRCFDNSSNNAFADANYSFIMDAILPEISSMSLNATSLNQSNSIRFNASITDRYGISSAYATLRYPNGTYQNISLNNSGDEYYFIFNNTLSLGIYNITYVWANDSYGQENSLSPGFSFNVTPSPPGEFSLLSPPDGNISNILVPNLSWQQSSDENFANYTILLDKDISFGSPDYAYATYNISNVSFVVTFGLDANTIYYWRVIAYDVFGNSRNSTQSYSYITDTLGPSITLNEPFNDTYSVGVAQFNYTPNDTNGIDRCILYGNWTGLFSPNETDYNIENGIPNYLSTYIVDGIYLWNVRCLDVIGNSRYAIFNLTVKVDNTGPSVFLVSPQNNTYENDTNNIVFWGNSTDMLAEVSNCTLIIDDTPVRDKEPITEGEIFNTTYFLENGQHNWSISCTDTNGNAGSSSIYNITVNVVDSDPPFILRNYPSNNQYIAVDYVLFNYTVDDATGIDNCSIYIDGSLNQTNSTVLNHEFNYFYVQGFSDDTYNWSIECYDNTTEENYVQTSTYILNIDLNNPAVTLNSPGSVSIPEYLNSSIVNFNYTVYDTNLLSCSLYGDFSGPFELQQINSSPLNGGSNYFQQELPDGQYLWNILCDDQSGRSAFASQNYTILIDTVPPQYGSISENPLSPTKFNLTAVHTFNITWTDNFEVSAVWIENDFYGTAQNFSVDEISGNTYSYNITGLAVGEYIYRWYANDTSRNINMTANNDYSVTKADPVLNLLINGSEYNYSIIQGQSVNLTADIFVPPTGNITLYIDGVMINYGIAPIINITQFNVSGIYNITVKYAGDSNYASGEETLFLTVNDTIAPTIILISPQNTSGATLGIVNLQYNVSDQSAIDNCSLYINGTLNLTNHTVTVGITQVFSQYFNEGDYSWRVECYDNSSNLGMSGTNLFYTLNTSIIKINVSSTKTEYESAETAAITINTKDFFDNNIITNITADIILGDAELGWWNTSWKYRKPILLSNPYNRTLGDRLIINITGLNGTITNCSKEIRIIQNDSYQNIPIPYVVLGGDNNNSCVVQFSADIPAYAINFTKYWAYYGNGNAAAESYSLNVSGIYVQRDTVAGTGSLLTASVEEVDRNKAFILFNAITSSSNPDRVQYTSEMLVDTVLRFECFNGLASSNISWQLIAGSDISVQRGLQYFTDSNTTLIVEIEEVDLNESFIIVDGRADSGSGGDNIRGFFRARFVNSTAIELLRGTSGSQAWAGWQVVQWDGARVQSNYSSTTSVGVTENIQSIDTSRSFIISSRGISGSTGMTASMIRGEITSSTQVNVQRNAASGTAYLSYFVVELPEGFSVQENNVSVGSSDQNVPVTAVDMNKSFHSESWTGTGGGTTYTNTWMTVTLTNTTNLFFDKQSTSQTNAVQWYIIEADDISASQGNADKHIARNINNSDGFGNLLWTWSTGNQTLENYSIVAVAAKTGLNTISGYSSFEITPDYTAPNVTLISPADMDIVGQGYFNFSYLPYDLNLKNCTLYYGTGSFLPNMTNSSPINNATNNFTDIYMGVGLYSWNVLCYDIFNNSAFAQYNYTLNITGPDLYVDSSRIWFSNDSAIEGTNITIYANISNEGLSPNNESFIVQFFRNDPDAGGIQINGNKTISILNPEENEVVNVSYILGFGLNNIFVLIDPYDIINETSEDNNNASIIISISLYQYYYGNIRADIMLAPNSTIPIMTFRNTSIYNGNIFIADSDSIFAFTNLQSLGRNKIGAVTNNDFSDLDTAINTTSEIDSISIIWTNNTDTPLITGNISLTSMDIYYVPFAESLNNTNFYTGILWDTADDLSENFQYDSTDKEDIILVAQVGSLKQGAYGEYNYEVRVPAPLKSYKAGNDMVSFYFELV